MLKITDITVSYGKVRALSGMSLYLDKGEIVTLIGANGAGKTTTLRTISGLLRPSTGSITFEDTDLTKVPSHKIVSLGISHAPEGRGIFPGMSIEENLSLGAYSKSPSAAQLRTDLDRMYTLFPVLKQRAKGLAGNLSGGEQQMLAIGRALMSHPSVLLLDEPSMGLAPQKVAQIFEIIKEINAQGTAILLVEQNATQALAIASRAYILQNGAITKSGPASELASDESVIQAYLGG